MRRLWLQLAAAGVFLLAWIQSSALAPRHESGTFSIDPSTPYTHYMPANTLRGRILVVHGLDVSRETMSLISSALADGGFEVYAITLPGHGDSNAKFETGLAEQAIRATMASIGEDTIVLGHSLGAGLLLDLAANQHFSTMVLLAPPPVSIAEIEADRVLVATGAIDLPRILSFVPIAADIGGPQVETWILPWAAHSTPIFNPVYVRRIVDWLGGDGAKTRTLARMVWLVLMFISATILGIGLLNSPPQLRRGKPRRSLGWGGAVQENQVIDEHRTGAFLEASPYRARASPRQPSSSKEENRITIALVRYVAACGGALLVLKFFNPLSWLRLFAADYLIAFVFITGIGLTVAALYERRGMVVDLPDRNALFKAIAAAVYVIGVLGFIVGSHLIHMSLSNDRWWRFPCILAAGFPLFTFDELIIRRLHPRWKPMAIALTTRGLLLAFLMVGVLILNRENAFLVLIAPLITVFWIGLWFAAGVVYRNTQDALATALFSALVQGWAFATWFVTI